MNNTGNENLPKDCPLILFNAKSISSINIQEVSEKLSRNGIHLSSETPDEACSNYDLVCVCLRNPIVDLAVRLETNPTKIESIFVAWNREIETLVLSHKRNRRKLLLVDFKVLSNGSDPELDFLSKKMRFSFAEMKPFTSSSLPKPSLEYNLFATALANSNPEIHEHLAYLFAATLGAERNSLSILDVKEIISEITSNKSAYSLLKEECELLRESLKQNAEEISLTHSIENDYKSRIKQIDIEKRQIARERDTLKVNMQTLLGTLSWRVTKPLRGVRRLFPRRP